MKMVFRCNLLRSTSIQHHPPSTSSSCCAAILAALVLLLLRGGADALYLSNYDNDTVLQPIMTLSQVHRVCAELCMSGLGGSPCGDSCVDVVPEGLPLQLSDGHVNGTTLGGVATRYDACETLCANGLGYPLCGCRYNESYTTNFLEVCSVFCVKFDYQMYGCQNCSLFKTASSSSDSPFAVMDLTASSGSTINWSLWCRNMCSKGDGGAACNCDLLPMDLDVNATN